MSTMQRVERAGDDPTKMVIPAPAVGAAALTLTWCAMPTEPDATVATPESETGNHGSNPRLDRVYDRCENGKAKACKTLIYDSPVGSEYEGFAQARYLELMEARDAEAYVAPTPQPEAPDPQPATWSCDYSQTYNDDWHDDVACSNGVEQHRPHLRGWDDFVTEDEMMQSAREYEQELNSW